ncbi:MAG: hypothetical protein PHQ23_14945, partial [Candidatus Wallbacteria bacterium]|nr:hypothetical protein [Candidatus Wallbacteria bacterium]
HYRVNLNSTEIVPYVVFGMEMEQWDSAALRLDFCKYVGDLGYRFEGDDFSGTHFSGMSPELEASRYNHGALDMALGDVQIRLFVTLKIAK